MRVCVRVCVCVCVCSWSPQGVVVGAAPDLSSRLTRTATNLMIEQFKAAACRVGKSELETSHHQDRLPNTNTHKHTQTHKHTRGGHTRRTQEEPEHVVVKAALQWTDGDVFAIPSHHFNFYILDNVR